MGELYNILKAANFSGSGGSGGGSVPHSDVNFYDYDGTIVHSYTADEFAELSEMPSNPTHEGLTAQGWNWTLANAKACVADYGTLNIGQMYVTSDGKTRLYIHLTEGRTTPNFQLYLNANSELDIDWGDGSAHSTFLSTSAGYKDETHEYSAGGDYVIAVTVISGSFNLQSSSNNVSSILWDKKNSVSSPDRAYANAIQRIEIGNGITSIGGSAFRYCYSLTNIVIPDNVTTIGANAFTLCCSLTSIVIPDGVTTIEANAFQNCCSLSNIVIPDSVTIIGASAFYNCYSLTSIVIPDNVTTIGQSAFQSCCSLTNMVIPDNVTYIGQYAFYGCYSLTNMVIPGNVTYIGQYAFQNCCSLASMVIPDSVTSIGANAFYSCFSLTSIVIPDNVTSIGANAFYNCYSLSSMVIPDNVTIIGASAFENCCSLSSIVIPDSVTTIGGNAFQNCFSLSSIVIPDSVTIIGGSAFENCSYLDYFKFKNASPAIVSSSNAFQNFSTTTLIIVPVNCLQAYISATNYPSSNTYTYLVSGTYASGVTLPTTSTDGYNLTWYATMNDARNQINPITQGNGEEVYARGVAV